MGRSGSRMIQSPSVASMALRSFSASKRDSVVSVYPEIILEYENKIKMGEKAFYIGVKDTNVIPFSFVSFLRENGYYLHTIDKASSAGRAIDFDLKNPITGRFMSGSSSGTAINVFKNINDLGIGTDGGGSVISPAISLNLFGFISPILCQDSMSKYSKTSTDGIVFTPSLGLISKELSIIINVLELIWNQEEINFNQDLIMPDNNEVHSIESLIKSKVQITNTKALKLNRMSRIELMDILENFDFENKVLFSVEGPVDVLEYGDSVMGHYDNETKNKQNLSYKNFSKVVNMMGLSAIVIPTNKNATGILIICKSTPNHIFYMMRLAEKISVGRSELETDYFLIQNDFKGGFSNGTE